MKKIILLFGIVSFLLQTGYAQERSISKSTISNPLIKGMHEIVIGEGTDLLRVPAHLFYRRSFSQTIYTPDQLGINGGTISKLSYIHYSPIASSDVSAVPFTIWIGETDIEVLAPNNWVPTANLTEVYNGIHDLSALGDQEVEFELDVPYQYNGGNLVIFTYRQDSGYNPSINLTGFYGVNSGYTGKSIYSYHDSNTPNPNNPSALGTNVVINGFPNVKILINTEGVGQIEGIVSNSDGPVSGASVKIGDITIITDTDGKYLFESLQPGSYDINVTAIGHYDKTETDVIVVADTKTFQDILLEKLPYYQVSGKVTGNDAPEGIENVEIIISGYADYPAVYTNATGDYTVFGVYDTHTYNISAELNGYAIYTGTVTINGGQETHNIQLNEILFPVGKVEAEIVDNNVKITWTEPVKYKEKTYILDDGTWENGIRSNPGYDYWIGNMFEVGEAGEITSIELCGMDNGTSQMVSYLTVEIFNEAKELVGISQPFIMQYNTTTGVWNHVEFATPVPYSGTFYAMIHWDMVTSNTGFAATDKNGPNIGAGYEFFAGEWYQLSADLLLLRVNANAETGKSAIYGYEAGKSVDTRMVQGYNVYRLLEGQQNDETLWSSIVTNLTELTYTDPGVNLENGNLYYYAVKAVYTDGALSAARFSNLIDWEMVDIKENVLSNVTLYPNPTTGELRIEISDYPISDIRLSDIEIYDIFGRKQKAESLMSEIGQSEIVINLSHLPAGLYFVKITTTAGVVIKKVVKE